MREANALQSVPGREDARLQLLRAVSLSRLRTTSCLLSNRDVIR